MILYFWDKVHKIEKYNNLYSLNWIKYNAEVKKGKPELFVVQMVKSQGIKISHDPIINCRIAFKKMNVYMSDLYYHNKYLRGNTYERERSILGKYFGGSQSQTGRAPGVCMEDGSGREHAEESAPG